jgi:hypothetical protein
MDSLYERIKVTTDNDGLLIKVKWFKFNFFILIVIIIIAVCNYVVFSIYSPTIALRDTNQTIFDAIGTGLFILSLVIIVADLVTLSLILNSTIIRISRHRSKVSYRPIPWFGFSCNTSELKEVQYDKAWFLLPYWGNFFYGSYWSNELGQLKEESSSGISTPPAPAFLRYMYKLWAIKKDSSLHTFVMGGFHGVRLCKEEASFIQDTVNKYLKSLNS